MKTESEKKGGAAHKDFKNMHRMMRDMLESQDTDDVPFIGQRSFDERMQNLGVQEKEDVIKWRSEFSMFMIMFLKKQYVVIVIFLFLQGFNLFNFHLDNYIFYILIAGTLVQSYFLVRIIFQYLFASKK